MSKTQADAEDAARETPEWARFLEGAGGALLIAAVTLVAYLPSLKAGFIWDDDTFLTNNALIRDPAGFFKFWTTREAPDYFPLVSSMLWVEWRIFGESPLGYHLVNIALHALSAILLWRAVARLGVPGALVAGLVFAVHPVNVQSVAWITERKNTLPMVFMLLTFLAWLRFDESRKVGWYWLANLLFLLTLLGKTSVVFFPLTLLLLAWWRQGRVTVKDLIRISPMLLLSLVLGVVTIVYQTRNISGESVRPEGAIERLAQAGWAVWFYLYKCLIPLNLSFIYGGRSMPPGALASWMPLAAMAGLVMFLLAYRDTWGRPALFALGGYILMLVPVLGIADNYFMRFSLVADHWQYAATVFLIPLVVGAVAYALRDVPVEMQAGVAGVPLALLLALAIFRGTAFTSSERLWQDTLRKNEGAWLAHNGMGASLLEEVEKRPRLDEPEVKFKLAESLNHLRRAVELNPVYFDAQVNLGNALSTAGRLDEAEASYEKAADILAKHPIDAAAQRYRETQLAMGEYQLFLVRREWDRARAVLDRLVGKYAVYAKALQTRFGAVCYDIGKKFETLAIGYEKSNMLAEREREYVAAARMFEETMRLTPREEARYAQARARRVTALIRLKRFDEADKVLAEAMNSPDPKDHTYDVAYNRGEVAYRAKRYADAIRWFEEALKLKSDLKGGRERLLRAQQAAATAATQPAATMPAEEPATPANP